MAKMSQGNKKITAGKLPAANNKILVCTGSLTKFGLFQKIPSINYKIQTRKLIQIWKFEIVMTL